MDAHEKNKGFTRSSFPPVFQASHLIGSDYLSSPESTHCAFFTLSFSTHCNILVNTPGSTLWKLVAIGDSIFSPLYSETEKCFIMQYTLCKESAKFNSLEPEGPN